MSCAADGYAGRIHKRLDATALRSRLLEVQTQCMARNHARIRQPRQCSQLDRYGDGVHNAAIAKIIATSSDLAATALLYQEKKSGRSVRPTRVQDVRIRSHHGLAEGKRSRWRADTMQWDTPTPGRVQRERKNLAAGNAQLQPPSRPV